MLTLYTAGYQGHTIETFLDLLGGHAIEHLIDVRQLPFSRKPDFSKKRLRAHLEAAGVGYSHIVGLGTPKPLRDEVRRTKDYAAFFAHMRTCLAEQGDALEEALALVRTRRCLLLCFEADPAACHRTVVAEALQERARDLEVIHR
ncbi:MAG TPA: DUF488 domain-containing protein [Roseiflexaceae bacterium]|nr:DUF488 domain-containing protein [Roseiflexaceae bacterium]